MEYRCNQCNHEWNPKKKGGLPMSCPRCKRYDWSEPKKGESRGKTVEAKTSAGSRSVETSRGDVRGKEVLHSGGEPVVVDGYRHGAGHDEPRPSVGSGDIGTAVGGDEEAVDEKGSHANTGGEVQVVRSRSKGVARQGDGKQPEVGVQEMPRQETPERPASDTGGQSFQELTEDDFDGISEPEFVACGYKTYNETTGDYMACRRPKGHSKDKHGDWTVVSWAFRNKTWKPLTNE